MRMEYEIQFKIHLNTKWLIRDLQNKLQSHFTFCTALGLRYYKFFIPFYIATVSISFN